VTHQIDQAEVRNAMIKLQEVVEVVQELVSQVMCSQSASLFEL
jgi:hypothetical protein